MAEAGATLQQVNEAAAEHGMMTGIDIPSRGSCTVGGAGFRPMRAASG